MATGTTSVPRKFMVVVDTTRESATALQYTLSHGVVEQDELILLHVGSPSLLRNALSTLFKRASNGNNHQRDDGGSVSGRNSRVGGGKESVIRSGGGGGGHGGIDFMEEMKKLCEAAQPKVRVRIERVEMEGKEKDKASVILQQSNIHGIDVLIIGQRRSLSTAILGCRRAAGGATRGRGKDTVEYLIENCKCTCVGVQRKGQNAGYLLNTKTHRNFWLLA